MSTKDALQQFEGVNKVQLVDPIQDALYCFDRQQQQAVMKARPWKENPTLFQKVRISAVALVKMTMHAHSGGDLEVMGLMQGKVDGDTMVVLDAFALPVEGTETRVNASNEANEYIVSYLEQSKKMGREENAIGWYHSHPGYGCWLSGIDVSTQMTNQMYQEPWVAVVIDPKRTVASGRVDIGAFRTYPQGYTPPNAKTSAYQTIPLEKIEDFGVHANAYYPLEVSIFKSSLDTQILELVWQRYWAETLSQPPLDLTQEYTIARLADIGKKAQRVAGRCKHSSGSWHGPRLDSAPAKRGHGQTFQMDQDMVQGMEEWDNRPTPSNQDVQALSRDAGKLSIELSQGLIAKSLRGSLF